MVEEIVGSSSKSGKYTGNGTSQQKILHTNQFNVIRITRADRIYVVTCMRDDGITAGMVAIGTQENYRTITITSGGISFVEGGFAVGNHASVNEAGKVYYWEVI